MEPQDKKIQPKNEQFARTVCLFLAEQLRVKKIGLRRAAEIAQKVSNNINLLDSETEFLKLIKELSVDFQELLKLERRIFFYMEEDQRLDMEAKVREFVVDVMSHDLHLALSIMLETIKEGTTLDRLKSQFPQFKQFMETPK